MTERMKNIDVAVIYDLWNEYSDAVNDGDFERWITLWAEDSLRVPPSDFGPRQFGKDEIWAAMQPLFESSKQKMIINAEGIEVFGDKAYSYGTFEVSVIPKGGGDTLTIAGNFLTVFAKQDDGSWKIAIDTWNH